MIRESVAYKIVIFLYRYLKESRIHELVSKLFYFSRYSIIFELVRKEPEQKNIRSSLFLRAAKYVYGFCITKAYNGLQKLKRLWSNSFLLKLLKSQIILFRKSPIFVFTFYIFVFYLGFFTGEAIKNRLSLTKLVILFVLLLINFLNFQLSSSKYVQNSLILKFFKEIFS